MEKNVRFNFWEMASPGATRVTHRNRNAKRLPGDVEKHGQGIQII